MGAPTQEVEDLIMSTGQASLSGKNYLQGGRLDVSVDWWVMRSGLVCTDWVISNKGVLSLVCIHLKFL